MAKQNRTKQRTREHILADLSCNFVQRIILQCGFTADRKDSDYGYDLIVETFDEGGCVEAGLIFVQLKATENVQDLMRSRQSYLAFSIDRRDIERWKNEILPVLLVLYDALHREGYWLHVQEYCSNRSIPDKGKTLTLEIPTEHIFGVGTIRSMQQRKNGSIPPS